MVEVTELHLNPMQLELLMLDQALRNAKNYEAHCNRQYHAAERDYRYACEATIKLANEIEALRGEMLKRGCV